MIIIGLVAAGLAVFVLFRMVNRTSREGSDPASQGRGGSPVPADMVSAQLERFEARFNAKLDRAEFDSAARAIREEMLGLAEEINRLWADIAALRQSLR